MADRYWIGGTGNWNDTDHWSASSGGSGGETAPAATDDTFFDGNSGTGTATVNVSAACLSLDCTGYTGTFAGSSALAVSGSLTMGAGMTNSYTGEITFNSTGSGNTLTTNSITLQSSLNFNGVGGSWTLVGNLTVSGSSKRFKITAGTFDANDNNITTDFYEFSGSSTRVLIMGNGTITSYGTGGWNASGTNLTITRESSTVKFTDGTNNNIIFTGGGKTYNNVWFSRGSSTGIIRVSNSNTFNTFQDTGTAAHTLRFDTGTTQTVSGFAVAGSLGNKITVSSTVSTNHTLTKTGGGVIYTCDYLTIDHSTATPGSTWYAGANSTDNGNNSGWIFEAAPTTTSTTTSSSTSSSTTTSTSTSLPYPDQPSFGIRQDRPNFSVYPG